MTPSPTTRPRHTARRFGGTYLIVLAIATVVTVVGSAALYLTRVQRRIVSRELAASQAVWLTQSAAEIALQRIFTNNNWRNTYTHDTWTSSETIGTGTFRFKLVDEIDGNLANDFADPVRLHVRVDVGDTVRLASVALAGGSAQESNVLTNGGFESGTTGWSANGTTTLDTQNNAHGGQYNLRVKNRGNASAGPKQSVMGSISSGVTYDTEVWVRMKNNSENVRVVFKTRTLLLVTTTTAMTPWTPAGTGWTRIAGTATPSWLDALSLADIYIETSSSSQEFEVDDFVIARRGAPVTPVAGSWRREVLP